MPSTLECQPVLPRRRPLWPVAATGMGAVLFLAGCAASNLRTLPAVAAAKLPPPACVVVHDFTAAPAQVVLDGSPGVRMSRAMADAAPAARQAQVAAQVTAALSQSLVTELQRRNVPAGHGDCAAAGSVVVEGRFVTIDEGNRMRRTVVGLGAGQSKVVAQAQIYYHTGTELHLLRSIEGTASSGCKPGAIEILGVGAVAERLATSAVVSGGADIASETRRAGVAAEAATIGRDLAKNLAGLFAAEGWQPSPAGRTTR